MRASLDRQRSTLALDFDAQQDLETYLADGETRGMFVVRLPEPLEVGEQITVRLSCRGFHRETMTQVQQVFRSGTAGHGAALRLLAPGPVPTPEAPEARPDEATSSSRLPEEETAAEGTEVPALSEAAQIRRMNVTQRMRLAMRATRLERQILLRDNSPQVLMGLLANPHIDDQEVLELVRSPHAASGVLQHVAKDRRWSSNQEIRLALVRNPKTPTPIAQRLLPTLRPNDLKVLAKSSNVREAIKGAALRLYLGKL